MRTSGKSSAPRTRATQSPKTPIRESRRARSLLWQPSLSNELLPVASVPPLGVRPTWLEIELGALDHNLRCLRRVIPRDCSILAVVKDNAYGHGMVAVARHLEGQVEALGVALLEEACVLRRAGIRKPLLVLGGLWPGQEQEAVQENIVPVVYSLEALRRLNAAAVARGAPAPYHLKVDTGMNRLGLPPDRLTAFLDGARELAAIRCEGLLTHLSQSESRKAGPTRGQLRRFRTLLQQVRDEGLRPRWIHAANSGGALHYPESCFNLIRPGIALYGYEPRGGTSPRLRPALSWKSRIALLKEMPAGSPVGYGAAFVTARKTRLATVPVGYGDGYARRWSGQGGAVLVGGKRVPVVGRVSMDSITVDVTSARGAREGDEVLILGRAGRVRLDAAWMARCLGTIPYEILTSLSTRLPRAFI